MTHVYGREDVALLTAEQSAAADREARETGGIPERVLMENAGRAAAQVIARLFPSGRVVGLLGSGHNGGDGLVALRALAAWGRDVAYVAAGSRPPDAALAHGFEVPALDAGRMGTALAGAAVLVDGILGTGASGAPRGGAAAAIEALNAAGRPVVALDLPSGVDPTTGHVPGAAVRASVTVTFGWPKLGLLLQPGRSLCGRLVAVEIGFPPRPPDPGGAALITPDWAAARLPARPANAHKGTSGRLLVLAGSRGMAGAAVLASRAAVRAGVGLVRAASPGANREVLQTTVPEAVFADRDDGTALRAAAADATALLAGPGLGLDDTAESALRAALESTAGRPALLDADALTLLGREPGGLRAVADERPLVITPHPGEAERLTGRPAASLAEAPVEAARALAAETGAVVVLKGMPSVIAAPGRRVLVNSVGSSDLASAGMGDALAGAIGAFLAGGVAPRTAAALGLFYSGRAADLAGRGRSLTPTDVADHLLRAFRRPGPARSPLRLPFVTFDQPPRR